MANKYIVRKGLKYLNSITFVNENLDFIPKWSRNKFNAFPFATEFDAQRVSEEIVEDGVKWEKINRATFKKGNDPLFQEDRRKFEKLLGSK